MQELPSIPQDAFPDSVAPTLLLASSSAPATDEALLRQAQDSLDNSLFSFQLGTTSAEDEVISLAESAPLSEETKAKLQEILQFLNQDIGHLVRDAKPIRTILKSLKGILPESLEEALHPAAYIESHQILVLKAQKRLSDRLHQEQAIKQRDDLKNLVETTSGKIVSLTQSKANMEQSKRGLEAKRERLIKELEQVTQEIADVDNELSQLPSALQQLEAEKQEQARQTYQLHKSIKPIPGSAEADNKEIQDADDIRLRAISVIQNALGSL